MVTWQQTSGLRLHNCYFVLVWLTCQTPAVGGLIVCVCVCVCVCVWVSLCVRRHVALLLGAWWMADYETLHVCRVPWCQQCVKFWWWPSDQIIWAVEISFVLRCFMGTAHHSCDAATGFAAVATRSRAGCWSMEDRRRPYQPKHSPSNIFTPFQLTYYILHFSV